jgi:hypothetical protein
MMQRAELNIYQTLRKLFSVLLFTIIITNEKPSWAQVASDCCEWVRGGVVGGGQVVRNFLPSTF